MPEGKRGMSSRFKRYMLVGDHSTLDPMSRQHTNEGDDSEGFEP